MTDLVEAAKQGKLEKVSQLLECGVDVNYVCGDHQYTAIYWSACNGHSKIVHHLIAKGFADVNKPTQWGSTALHAASERGHKECILYLCQGKADVNCQNYSHMDTPLHLAAYRGHLDVCKLLVYFGASTGIANKEGKTCIDDAYAQKRYHVYEYLSQHSQGQCSSDLNLLYSKENSSTSNVDIKGNSPIHPPNGKATQRDVGPKLYGFMDNLQKDPQQGIPHRQCDLDTDIKYFNESNQYNQDTIVRKVIPSEYTLESANDVINIGHTSNQEVLNIYKNKEDNITEKEYLNQSDYFYKNVVGVDRGFKMETVPRSSPHFFKNKPISTSNVEAPTLLVNDIQKCKLPVGNQSPVCNPCLLQNNNQPILHHHDHFINSKNSNSFYLKTIESLQLQIIKERDKVQFLEKKNTDLWLECERARGNLQDQHIKLALNTNYKRKYEVTLEENETLKKRLVECDERARLLAQLLTKYQNYSVSNSVNNTVDTITTNSHTAKMDEKGLFDVSNKSGKKKTSNSSSSSNSSADNSFDSFTKKILSTAGKQVSHVELYRAIKPAFQFMGQSFQRTIGASLKSSLAKTLLKPIYQNTLDTLGKEWVCGEHFVFEDEDPINRKIGLRAEGSSSLVFRIRLEGATDVYILKMMINLLDLSQTKHGAGQSYPLYLYQQFSPEHDIPTLLPPHSNIVPILHYYNGSTLSFQHHLPACFPLELQDPHSPVEMASETTFIVMPEYPTTLEHFFTAKLKHYDLTEDREICLVLESFILQKLFEILSGVHHLLEHKVVHRDIKADNVFLDHDLRAILGDFGFARRFQTIDGSSIPFVEKSQAMAGNSGAWSTELATLNRNGPESLERQMNLEDIYHTTDAFAVGNMFFHLLAVKRDDEINSHNNIMPKCFSIQLRQIIQELTNNDFNKRLTAKDGMLLIGLMMFGPTEDEVLNEDECHVWHHARRMKLLVQKPVKPRVLEECGYAVLNLKTSTQLNEDILERYFFVHTTAEEIWKGYQQIQGFKEN